MNELDDRAPLGNIVWWIEEAEQVSETEAQLIREYIEREFDLACKELRARIARQELLDAFYRGDNCNGE